MYNLTMKKYSKYLFYRKWAIRVIFSIILSVLFATPLIKAEENVDEAKSDTTSYNWERFSFILGGFFTGLSSDMIIGVDQVGLGISLNLEQALGLESTTLAFRSELEYNFGKRNRSSARIRYFGLYRNANKILDSEIEIGDQIFPIGTELTSRFDLMIFKANYDYTFFMDDRVKLSFTVGLFIMPISFSTSALGLSEEAVYFVAPLPVLGLRTGFAIAPKVFLKQSIEVLYLEISSFKGGILDFSINIEYNPWKHFGFGLGINAYQLNIIGDKNHNSLIDFNGSVKTGYTGLLFYGKFYF